MTIFQPMTAKKKRCLVTKQADHKGTTDIDASIWNIDEEAGNTVLGVGLLEVEIGNWRLRTTDIIIEAEGSHIRWETQPYSNKKFISNVLGGREKAKPGKSFISEIFEVKNTAFTTVNVFVEGRNRGSIPGNPFNKKVQLQFKASAISKQIYRNENFEKICTNFVQDFEIANIEMIEFFSKHPKQLHKLTWRKYEELLAGIFSNLGYRTLLGPGRGDEGVDIRIYQNDEIGEILTLVQAKKYNPKRPIGLEPVAALSAIVDIENAQRGLFVTTSRFLPVARRFAEKKARRILLADSSEVSRWCEKVISKS